MPALITAAKVEDRYVVSDKFILYKKLQAMNLQESQYGIGNGGSSGISCGT